MKRGSMRFLIKLCSLSAWQRVFLRNLHKIRFKLYGVDLEEFNTSELGSPAKRALTHMNSGGPDLDRFLRSLSIKDTDAVIDFGCGKGSALLTLANYPFRLVDGIELSPELAQVARENLTRMGVKNVRVFTCDAAEFRDLDLYTFVYMFNPFPDSVMRHVMQNLVDSLVRKPRRLMIIYLNPVCHDRLVTYGFRKTDEVSNCIFPLFVYQSVGDNLGSRSGAYAS